MTAGVFAAPTTVAIAASTRYFQSYSSGVLTDGAKCGDEVDHAVVAVGYNTNSDGVFYWIVRNSWNTTWGEQGYVNLAGEASGPGVCYVQSQPAYAVTN